MKFILNKDTVEIENIELAKSGSISYYEADVEYDSSWNDLTIEAVIVKKDEEVGTSIAVINKKIYIDQNLKGTYCIGFVGYKIEDNKKTYQVSTNLQKVYFDLGAGEIETQEQELPTLTEWEIYIAQIQEMIKGVQSIPSGGTAGQVLSKKSDSDYDYEWRDQEGGGIGTEEDPTVPEHVKNISEKDIQNWNNKSEFSGNYNDLSNKPDIPNKTSDLENDNGFISEEQDPSVPSHVKNITKNNIDSWNNKASITDMTNYIEEHKENLQGPEGPQGEPGKDGINGTNGKDGYTPVKGVDYFDGKDGANGKDGENGQDGYTPVKGVDYYTEEDKQEMVNLVLGALPSSEEVDY